MMSIKYIHIILLYFLVIFSIKGQAQIQLKDTVKMDIILNNSMLKEVSIKGNFINSIDYTPTGFLLLASSDQFYMIGWGNMSTVFKKTKTDINAFTVTQDGTLWIISGNTLYSVDEQGNLSVIYDFLPIYKPRIVSSNQESLAYIYDHSFREGDREYMLCQISDKEHKRLLSTSTPILSVYEYKTSLLLSTENKIMCADSKTKSFFELFTLSQKSDIISITGDTVNHAIYFSTQDTIYRIKNGTLEYVSTELGGILKYDGEGLLIFNPEKSLIIRLRNNLLYQVDTTTATTISKETTETKPNIQPSPRTEEKPPQAVTPKIEQKTTNKTETISTNPTTLEIEALDYVIPLKDLVVFFDNQRINFANKVNTWAKSVSSRIEKINADYANVVQAEKELNAEKNKTIFGSTMKINDLKTILRDKREAYKSSQDGLKQDGVSIITQLKGLSKSEAAAIHQKFQETKENINPTTAFPAKSSAKTAVFFSNRIENVQTLSYLKPTNELLYWYQNIEHYFYQKIGDYNKKINAAIQKDKELESQMDSKQKQQADYPKNSKTYKNLKKEIDEIGEKRKQQAKLMKENSKELATWLKIFDKEVQNACKERIKNVIDELNYSFQINQ